MEDKLRRWVAEGLTQNQMATHSGFSQSYIAKLLARYELKTVRARRVTPKRWCEQCGQSLTKQRRFCSNVCQGQSEYEGRVARWLAGDHPGADAMGLVSGFVRRYLYESRGECCEQCGWAEINHFTSRIPLVVHHLDGDADNSTQSNLQILCGSCHSLTATFGAHNRGNGRQARYARRTPT